MPPHRSHLRRRLALEFVLIAGAIHLVLVVVIIGIWESQLRQSFDGDLLRRAERAAGAAAQDLVPPTALPAAIGAEILSSRMAPLHAQARALDGQVISSTSRLEGAALPLPFTPGADEPPARPLYTTIAGELLARPGERFRLVTLYEDGPPPYYLQAAISSASLDASITFVRRLLFLLAFPGAMVGTGAAAWLISGQVVRRIEDVARAATPVGPQQAHPRHDVPAASDEIGGMVVEMNAMLSRLENAFRSQERFIVDVTHELKTPVSVMLAEAQVLKKTKSAEVERYREFVVSVEEEMRRLGSLLESFLTLARSGHGPRYVSESLVEVADVVLDAIQRSESIARGRMVKLEYVLPLGAEDEAHEAEHGIAVRGDQELLTTLVANLLRNAVESSVPSGTVEVSINQLDSEVKVSIAHQYVSREGQTPNTRGRELAFSVAKGIAELHGGEIQTSRTGDRDETLLRLPVVRAA